MNLPLLKNHLSIPNQLGSSRRVLASRVGVTLVLLLGGSTAGTAPAAAVENPGKTGEVAQRLAELSADEGAARDYVNSLPPEVVRALGYTPVVVDGMPADPDGDCSSPVTLPESFTPACLTHDLGYDLLRVANEAGESIPGDLRPALDRQLARRMSDSCSGDPVRRTGCRITADVAHAAVAVNSWRQHEGAPVTEKWLWT